MAWLCNRTLADFEHMMPYQKLCVVGFLVSMAMPCAYAVLHSSKMPTEKATVDESEGTAVPELLNVVLEPSTAENRSEPVATVMKDDPAAREVDNSPLKTSSRIAILQIHGFLSLGNRDMAENALANWEEFDRTMRAKINLYDAKLKNTLVANAELPLSQRLSEQLHSIDRSNMPLDLQRKRLAVLSDLADKFTKGRLALRSAAVNEIFEITSKGQGQDEFKRAEEKLADFAGKDRDLAACGELVENELNVSPQK